MMHLSICVMLSIVMYRPGIITAALSAPFSDLVYFLLSLVKKTDVKNSPYKNYFNKFFAQEEQMQFCHMLLKTIGISGENTKLDYYSSSFLFGYTSF